jgi:glycosyltransferase involved in cell wall biosynthesis
MFDKASHGKIKKANIGISAFPLPKIENRPLSQFIDVIYPLSKDIYVITGEGNIVSEDNLKKIHAHEIECKSGANIITKVVVYIRTQLRILYEVLKLSKNVDLWIFYTGGEMPLSMIAARLLNKKTLLILASSPIACLKTQRNILLSIPLVFSSKISCTLSNIIIVYSRRLAKEWNLEKYKSKILVAHEHFIDFDKFKIKKKFDERENVVGYIGRLNEGKGTLNFIKAIPEISEEKDEIKFLIGGDGRLRDKIERYLGEENLNDKVKLAGWIPHDDLPDYMNELKLVVLPSYTEGLPNIMLEAMACGTPVLATPVGAIPDIIKDGETGFIMENNSPEGIAKNVERVLNCPNLDEIVKNARELVEKEYTYEAAVERYRMILKGLS